MSDGPLAGVRVVEFGNLIAAPYAGMLLADLGAEVIKVEPPFGDLGRGFGPYHHGESAFFLAVNRGKRSVALDPKDPAAHRWLVELVKTADVILSNLRFGAMDRMGFGEDDVRTINPRAVYAVVSAFGADGPYVERAGIDVIFQGESGMISITGHEGDPPSKTATTIGDFVAATNAAFAISAALVEAARTGRGRRVDVSLRDGLFAVQAGWYAIAFASGTQPARIGTASPFLAPNGVFATSDGHFTLAIVSERHYHLLCDTLDRSDLVERWPTNEERMEHRHEVEAAFAEIFLTGSTEHWIELLGGAGLPVGRVLGLLEAIDDPQAAYHGMHITYDHPVAGTVDGVGSPIRVEGDQARASRLPPVLGANTAEVLRELGATDDEIAAVTDS